MALKPIFRGQPQYKINAAYSLLETLAKLSLFGEVLDSSGKSVPLLNSIMTYNPPQFPIISEEFPLSEDLESLRVHIFFAAWSALPPDLLYDSVSSHTNAHAHDTRLRGDIFFLFFCCCVDTVTSHTASFGWSRQIIFLFDVAAFSSAVSFSICTHSIQILCSSIIFFVGFSGPFPVEYTHLPIHHQTEKKAPTHRPATGTPKSNDNPA